MTTTTTNEDSAYGPDEALENGLLTKEQTAPLLLYISAAALLPRDDEGYRLEIGVSSEDFTQLKNEKRLEVSKIIETQGNIKDHCSAFNDKEYPKMINLASLLRDYADKVGPPQDTSFLGNLYTQAQAREAAATAMREATDAAKRKEYQDTIDDCTANLRAFLGSLLDDAQALTKESEAVVVKLKEFEGQCREDSKDLDLEQKRTKDALTGEKSITANVEHELTKLHDEWHETYVKFVVATTAAATSFLWLGLPVIGMVIFPIAAGVGGSEAKTLHDKMGEIDDKIAKDEAEIAKYKKLMLNVGIVSKKVEELSNLVGPAIAAVTKFKDVWTTMVADLSCVDKVLSGEVAEDAKGKQILASLAKANVGLMMKKWERVGKRADAFRLSAYTTKDKPKIESKTFAEVQALLKKYYPS